MNVSEESPVFHFKPEPRVKARDLNKRMTPRFVLSPSTTQYKPFVKEIKSSESVTDAKEQNDSAIMMIKIVDFPEKIIKEAYFSWLNKLNVSNITTANKKRVLFFRFQDFPLLQNSAEAVVLKNKDNLIVMPKLKPLYSSSSLPELGFDRKSKNALYSRRNKLSNCLKALRKLEHYSDSFVLVYQKTDGEIVVRHSTFYEINDSYLRSFYEGGLRTYKINQIIGVFAPSKSRRFHAECTLYGAFDNNFFAAGLYQSFIDDANSNDYYKNLLQSTIELNNNLENRFIDLKKKLKKEAERMIESQKNIEDLHKLLNDFKKTSG